MPIPLTHLATLAAILGSLICPGTVEAEPHLLGKIHFPNSGALEAQADFLEGVLYLHNFE